MQINISGIHIIPTVGCPGQNKNNALLGFNFNDYLKLHS